MLFKSTSHFLKLLICAILLASCNRSDNPKVGNSGGNTENNQQNKIISSSVEPEAFENVLASDSLNISVRLRLAAYYYSTLDFEKALFHNAFVNRIDPQNMAAIFNLGNIYYDTQQNEQAIKYYKQFLEIDNSNCNVRCDLATCYLRLRNHEEAISLLHQNIKINPRHPQSHYNLSVILKESGKIKEAEEELKIYNNLVSGQPNNDQ